MSTAAARGVIASVAWRRFRVPFRAEFGAAHGAMTAREGFIVEVTSASGDRGVGEASPLRSFAGGSLAETAQVLEVLARAASGRLPGAAFSAALDEPGVAPGSLAAARCGFETALADLAARHAGVSLGHWLAAEAEIDVSPAAKVPVNAVIDMDTAEGVTDAVRAAVAGGFLAVKIKVGGEPLADARRVAAAREAGGRSLEIRADANRAWSEADAYEFFADAEPFHLALCEEPLAPSPDHYRALARFRGQVSVPIGIDESCTSAAQLQEAIFAGAADVAVVKPMITGLFEALRMLRLAREGGLRTIVTTTFDTGIGTALAVHLASLLSGPIPACGLATLDHLEHPLVLQPPVIDRGQMTVPPVPGLGVELDRDALERYATAPAVEVTA